MEEDIVPFTKKGYTGNSIEQSFSGYPLDNLFLFPTTLQCGYRYVVHVYLSHSNGYVGTHHFKDAISAYPFFIGVVGVVRYLFVGSGFQVRQFPFNSGKLGCFFGLRLCHKKHYVEV